ncbi:MAG: hypothetical protein ACR2MY_14490 [Candidatus Dormibacteria bacterium]
MNNRIRPALAIAGLAISLMAGGVPTSAASPSSNCTVSPDALLTGGGQLRVFAMQHKQDLADDATYQSIRDSLDCELAARVDPYRAADHPNLVVYNELNGLAYGTEGSRGAAARSGGPAATLGDQLVGVAGGGGIGTVAAGYGPPLSYYTARFGVPAGVPGTVSRLFTALTDTMVRAVVENVSALAKKHGVYIVFGAPLAVQEGAACTGQYAGWVACPGWHRSTSPADIAALQDPDLAPAPFVYVADTDAIDNVALFFGPDGALYDMQPKVNLTGIEIGTLGWHQAAATTIHAIPLEGNDAARFPQVRMGVGISLDAFETATSAAACPVEASAGTRSNPFPQFMQCLDSKGVNVLLQPEFNDGSKDCASWTDFTEDCGAAQASWQPLSWMRSSWFAVQGRAPSGAFLFPHFRYAVNPFLVGNLFDITGDGQSAIFARDDPRARPGWYAGDRSAALYNGTGVGTYTDRADDPRYRRFEGPQDGFLALTPWVIPEGSPGAAYRCRPMVRAKPDCQTATGPPASTPGALAIGEPGSLQSCEKGLAPGSGVASGTCAENQYRASVLVADLFPTGTAPTGRPAPSPSPAGLPLTTTTALPPMAATLIAATPLALIIGVVLLSAAWRRRRL